MPKKFVGLNSKAAAAKTRKDEKSEAERSKKEKEEDEAQWKDDDKNAQKKKERKDKEEQKKAELQQKKVEKQRLLEEEEANLKGKVGKVPPPTKVTREEIRIRQSTKPPTEKAAAEAAEVVTHLEVDLPENLNRLQLDQEEARTIEEAIDVLGKDDVPEEKHPERRMKAAYEEFESQRLPELKEENPSLRLSQLKQMMKKEWVKHPNNPFNKTTADYNRK